MKKFAAAPLKSVVKCQLSIVTFIIFTIFYLLFTISPVHAQCTYDPNATEQELINQFNQCAIEENIYDDKIFNFNQIAGTIDSLNTQILGTSLLHPQTNEITQGRGALAAASSLVAGLFANPPASGVQYFAGQIQKFNPVQPAYAQTGLGFDALSPVQKLWEVFRNASYVGFVIVFVVMGFMIMFRAHISPQAVATVQDSIPRIVVALILVTFSYAIAGLMIDLMFLVINIIIALLAQSGVIEASRASTVIFNKSIIGVITGAWTDIFKTAADAISKLLVDTLIGGDLLGILKFTLGGIGGLIVGIAALFIMFRILLMLLMAYVMIILLTIIAPFFFLIQSLPGNNGAREWFKQMTANVAVFPAVSLMIIFAGVIGGISAFGGTGAGTLKDTALQFPLLVGGLPENAIGKIIGLGILFMTPEAANLVKNAVGSRGPSLGGAGVAAVGASAGFLGRRIGQSSVARGVGEALEVGGQQRAVRFANLVPPRLRGGQVIQAPAPVIRGRVKT